MRSESPKNQGFLDGSFSLQLAVAVGRIRPSLAHLMFRHVACFHGSKSGGQTSAEPVQNREGEALAEPKFKSGGRGSRRARPGKRGSAGACTPKRGFEIASRLR